MVEPQVLTHYESLIEGALFKKDLDGKIYVKSTTGKPIYTKRLAGIIYICSEIPTEFKPIDRLHQKVENRGSVNLGQAIQHLLGDRYALVTVDWTEVYAPKPKEVSNLKELPKFETYEYNISDRVVYQMTVPYGSNISDTNIDRKYHVTTGKRAKGYTFSYSSRQHVPQGEFVAVDDHIPHTLSIRNGYATYGLTKHELDSLPVSSWKKPNETKEDLETVLAYIPSLTSHFYYEKVDKDFYLGLILSDFKTLPTHYGLANFCTDSHHSYNKTKTIALIPVDKKIKITSRENPHCLYLFNDKGQVLSYLSVFNLSQLQALSANYWRPFELKKLGVFKMTNPKVGTFLHSDPKLGDFYYIKRVSQNNEVSYQYASKFAETCEVEYPTVGVVKVKTFVPVVYDGEPRTIHARTLPTNTCVYSSLLPIKPARFIKSVNDSDWKKISNDPEVTGGDIFLILRKIHSGETTFLD